jgi:hypothetical protein
MASGFFPYFNSPQGYPPPPPMPWNYPTMSLAPSHAMVQSTVAAGPSTRLNSLSGPTLDGWCLKHNLGEEERQALIKLGFRVGDNMKKVTPAEWEWTGLPPLPRQRILDAYDADQVI